MMLDYWVSGLCCFEEHHALVFMGNSIQEDCFTFEVEDVILLKETITQQLGITS
jgi:hypothetical protein